MIVLHQGMGRGKTTQTPMLSKESLALPEHRKVHRKVWGEALRPPASQSITSMGKAMTQPAAPGHLCVQEAFLKGFSAPCVLCKFCTLCVCCTLCARRDVPWCCPHQRAGKQSQAFVISGILQLSQTDLEPEGRYRPRAQIQP